ncbi:MAG: sulfatase-like hydrolase/transferase [Deltaproteobacteria bacterium]|nr:sulfatase-like hydrolase/transferase [Deltaproteobacteria bacterium]
MGEKTARNAFGLVLGTACAATAQTTPDRTTLPVPEPKVVPSKLLDVRDAKAPEGAPNVLVALIDDLGFAGTSSYGGPIGTPTFDRLAGQGLIYNNFRTIDRAPWEPKPRRGLTEDIWELYDTRTDFSLVNDLSKQNPQKLAELQELFLQEAEKNNVLPIDDRVFERVNAALAGRTAITLAQGMTGMSENVFLNIKNKSKTINAEVEIPKGKAANGAIIVQGGRFGGWALYLKDGVPAYDYNFLGLERTTVAGREKLQPDKATIRFEFAYDGGGAGKGGLGTLYVNDQQVGAGRIERTQPMIFSADETADVGIDLATPVVEAIGSEAKSRFTGRIWKGTVAVRPEPKQAAK